MVRMMTTKSIKGLLLLATWRQNCYRLGSKTVIELEKELARKAEDLSKKSEELGKESVERQKSAAELQQLSCTVLKCATRLRRAAVVGADRLPKGDYRVCRLTLPTSHAMHCAPS